MRELRDDGPPLRLKGNALPGNTPGASPYTTRAAPRRLCCARAYPATSPRNMYVGDVLSPSSRARIGVFGSTAAVKCVSSATMDPFQTKRGRSAWKYARCSPYTTRVALRRLCCARASLPLRAHGKY